MSAAAPAQPVMPVYPMHQMPEAYNISDIGSMEEMEIMDEISGSPVANVSDPPPVLSNNPPTVSIALFKELTGFPNYGNPSGNADILYTGNRGVWTFNIPAFFAALGNLRAQIVIRAVLDDHQNVPVSQYSARIVINGSTVHTGRLPLVHGSPVGGRFTNWRSLTFNVPNLRRNNNVVITNTSSAGPDDWIALDWIELRLTPATQS